MKEVTKRPNKMQKRENKIIDLDLIIPVITLHVKQRNLDTSLKRWRL